MMKSETGRMQLRLHDAIQTIHMVFLKARIDPLEAVYKLLAVQLKSTIVSWFVEYDFFLLATVLPFEDNVP